MLQAVAAMAIVAGLVGAGPSTAPEHPSSLLSRCQASATNGYRYGSSTYYVASRRAIPSNWGNALTWYAKAKECGYEEGTEPVVGAIAWSPSGPLGHVAYVEAVTGSKVIISEMNYIGWNRVTTRMVSKKAFRYIYWRCQGLV